MLPLQSAYNIVGALVGCQFNEVDETVIDGIAEVANILVGSAKARLALNDGIPLELGLPTVVRAKEVSIDQPSGTLWVDLHFKSSHGPFVLRIALRRAKDACNDAAPVTSRALIVNESVVMRKVLSGALARADVKRVEQVDSDGLAAKLEADSFYDLILVDCGGGFRTGLDCIQRVRAAGLTVPILTILAETDCARTAVKAGATDVVTKPFHPNLVAVKVRELLTDFWAKEKAPAQATHI
jgi:CheY-like chemotaxis protein